MISAEAAACNKHPILAVLKEYLSNALGTIFFEIASGTGEHIAHFAPVFPNVTFIPSDISTKYMASVDAYIQQGDLTNVKKPVFFDASKQFGDQVNKQLASVVNPASIDIVYNTNMIHISSTAAVEGLFRTAGLVLKVGGILFTYGPYAIHGTITPNSNVEFDLGLRSQNPDWGLRDVDYLEGLARQHGLTFTRMHDMPVNNKVLIFTKN